MAVRLMLVDDHQMLREGLARALESEDVEVVGQARDGAEAVELAAELSPEVILMDVTMPNLGGVEATRQIHEAQPRINIVMLTMHADHEVLAAALRAGAVGYLVKDCSTEEIVEAVRMAARGEPAVSPQLAANMLTELRRIADEPDTTADERIVTAREEEVLQLIVEGCSTNEIAEKMFISPKTVKNHLASIYAKLEARDRTDAVMRAVRMGIVHLD